MIQNLFSSKIFAAVFITSGLILLPLRLYGQQLLSPLFVFIVALSLSPAVAVFAEVPFEKKEIPATRENEAEAWTGIDVSIVGKYAAQYGRPPRDPYINTDQGDLLLFVFTLAGVVGGFVIGFNARKLFYEK